MFAYRHVLESSSMHACVHPSIHVLCPLFLFFSPELNLPFLFSPLHPHSLSLPSSHLTSPHLTFPHFPSPPQILTPSETNDKPSAAPH